MYNTEPSRPHNTAQYKELEKIRKVESATADHEAGTVVLQLTGDVKEEKLKKAVEEAGFTYIG